MKRFPFYAWLLFAAGCVACSTMTVAQTYQSPVAQEVSDAFAHGVQPDVLVIFKEKADLSHAALIHGKAAKAEWTFGQLRAVAERTQARVRAYLLEASAMANSFYIVNAISVKACTPAVAEGLSQFAEIEKIVIDPWISMDLPIAQSDVAVVNDRSAVEWGIERINAPQVWAMGYTGQGITVGGADTGYDWVHPAIKPHYRGYDAVTDQANHTYNWHDGIHEQSPLSGSPDNPCGYNLLSPCDDNNHGTHTMGTMTGDDNMGNQIGVAPGARWVACRNMERGNGQPSSYIECFEWFLAPTDLNNQNPNPAKAPHVINNSWYCSEGEGCTSLAINDLMRQAIVALKASGVFVVVSNGNFGSNCASTNYAPAYFEESFSVGAIQPNDTIAGFSSRGPVTIDGSMRVKPNVSAPGQNVRSSIPNGNYANFSGTSMSGPHVVGLVALILSANPDLIGEVATVEDLIESTCTPRIGHVDCTDNNGTAYPNNTYGFGTVNALAAVQKALSLTDVPDGPASQASVTVIPNPVSDQLFLQVKGMTGSHQLRIYSADGRLIYSEKQTQMPQLFSWKVPVTHLSSGSYFWRITGEQGEASGTFLKN